MPSACATIWAWSASPSTPATARTSSPAGSASGSRLRALATHSKIVLADEPTANLDSKTGSSILKLMRDINRQSGTTFVFSTHDRKVMNMADRLVRIADGQITALGMKADDRWVFVEERAPREDETPEI